MVCGFAKQVQTGKPPTKNEHAKPDRKAFDASGSQHTGIVFVTQLAQERDAKDEEEARRHNDVTPYIEPTRITPCFVAVGKGCGHGLCPVAYAEDCRQTEGCLGETEPSCHARHDDHGHQTKADDAGGGIRHLAAFGLDKGHEDDTRVGITGAQSSGNDGAVPIIELEEADEEQCQAGRAQECQHAQQHGHKSELEGVADHKMGRQHDDPQGHEDMDEGEAALPAVGDPKTISHKQAEQQGIPHEVGVEYLKEGRVVDGTDHATEPFEQVLQGEGIGHPGEIVREDADEQHGQ